MESPVDLHSSPPIGTIDPVTARSNGKALAAWLHESRIRVIVEHEGLYTNTARSIAATRPFILDSDIRLSKKVDLFQIQ